MSGRRFTRELTNLPAEMAQLGLVLRRTQRNSTKSTRWWACARCGRPATPEEPIPVTGLCRRRECNPLTERWRQWRPAEPIPFYAEDWRDVPLVEEMA